MMRMHPYYNRPISSSASTSSSSSCATACALAAVCFDLSAFKRSRLVRRKEIIAGGGFAFFFGNCFFICARCLFDLPYFDVLFLNRGSIY